MPALSDLDTSIASAQALLDQLQQARLQLIDDCTNPVTLRLTALKMHGIAAPQDFENPASPWTQEENAGGTADELWARPEHAYWFRTAPLAVERGMVDPVRETS
jgi:hypothetical protein